MQRGVVVVQFHSLNLYACLLTCLLACLLPGMPYLVSCCFFLVPTPNLLYRSNYSIIMGRRYAARFWGHKESLIHTYIVVAMDDARDRTEDTSRLIKKTTIATAKLIFAVYCWLTLLCIFFSQNIFEKAFPYIIRCSSRDSSNNNTCTLISRQTIYVERRELFVALCSSVTSSSFILCVVYASFFL